MPVLIPLVAAFAAGAGGVAALGAAAAIGGTLGTLATVAAYATIAGAVLTGVGAIMGSKDLMKIGAVLSIGGGITSLGTGLAAGAAGDVAVSGMDLAADAGAGGANSIEGAAAAVDAAAPVATPVAENVVPPIEPSSVAPIPDAPGTPALNAEPGSITTAFDAGKAVDASAAGNIGPDTGAGLTGPGGPGTSMMSSPTDSLMTKVTEAGKSLNGQDIASWWEKAQKAGGAVGNFIEKNPSLVKIGGDMLSSAFGPQAEQLDWQKSIYNRARANLNAPVTLTYRRGN